ncbi:hypothetical protein ABPG72_008406 [Tetrahymena utriculariae]
MQNLSKVQSRLHPRPEGEGGGGGGRTKEKGKSLQETHKEMLKNIESTNIGKPTIVEAQRILKIIDNLSTNLTIFIYLDSELISKFLDVAKHSKLSKDLVSKLSQRCLDLLKSQAEIEAKFKPYASLLDQSNKEAEDVEEEKMIDAERLRMQLENNFKDLVRHLRNSPEDFEIIKSMKTNVNPDLNDLVHCIHCQKVIMLKKLSTASEEDENHKAQLHDLEKKIEELELKKNGIESELKKKKEERQKFSKEKKEELEKLKNEIAEVKAEKEKKASQLKNELDNRLKLLERDHLTKKDKLDKELQKLEDDFAKLKQDHANDETKLKTNKRQQQNSLADNIESYDALMKDQHQKKQEIEEELAKIIEEVDTLKQLFMEIDEEKQRERELEEEFRLKKEQWEIQERRKKEAARCILHFLMARKEKSKKKKKKKGKKKK